MKVLPMRMLIIAAIVLLIIITLAACASSEYGRSKKPGNGSGFAKSKKHNGTFRIY